MDAKTYIELVRKEFLEFCSYVTASGLSVDIHLTHLVIEGIISTQEKALIKNAVGLDQATMLYQDILPTKGEKNHWALVKIFRDHDCNDLADNLAERLHKLKKLSEALPKKQQQVAGDSHASHGVPMQAPPPQQVRHQTPVPLSAPIDFWSHTDKFYKLELELYEKAYGEIVATDGPKEFHVERMTVEPYDKVDNDYYDNIKPNQGNVLDAAITGEKGLALLLNNHDYSRTTKYGDRTGSVVDFTNMKNLLHKLNYKVVQEINRKGDDMINDAKNFAVKFNDNAYQSCVVVVMTHGEEGQFIGVDGQAIAVEKFFEPIVMHKALLNKPKIFIIQACRGVMYNFGQIAHDGDAPSKIGESEKENNQALKNRIPVGADTCYLYSTTPGYYSWRDFKRGSWFIQAICQEFSANAHKPWADLMTLATRVTKKVSTEFDHKKKEGVCVQLPHTETYLMKKFHFYPGK